MNDEKTAMTKEVNYGAVKEVNKQLRHITYAGTPIRKIADLREVRRGEMGWSFVSIDGIRIRPISCMRAIHTNKLTTISPTMGAIFPQRVSSTLAVKITTSSPTIVDATHILRSTCVCEDTCRGWVARD